MAQDERFIKGTTLTFTGKKVRYAYLIDPDTAYRHQWSVEVLLDATEAKEMKDLGFNIKDTDEGPLIKLKKYCTTAAGKPMQQPRLVGLDPKVPFTEEVGNGSTCNVKAWCIYRTVKGKEILCAYLDATQVVELVERTGSTGGFEDLSTSTDF